jgi:hypothetical protein
MLMDTVRVAEIAAVSIGSLAALAFPLSFMFGCYWLVPRQSSLDKFSASGCPDGMAPLEENADGQRQGCA